MNRFDHTRHGAARKFFFWLPVLLFVFAVGIFLYGMESVSSTTAAKQKESLETALDRSITQCYAVEGMYPPDLTYLKNHYGLTYDEEVFFVDYTSYGSNLRPEVTVLRRTNQKLW